jgi:hypothetical protein
MKTVRFVTFLIAAILVFSVWTPSPALARADTLTTAIGSDSVSANADFTDSKVVKLTITNHTAGTLFVTLIGQKTYFFAVTNRGKAKHEIEAGTYTYFVSSSSCRGVLSKTTYFKDGGSIGPVVCHKNLKISPLR